MPVLTIKVKDEEVNFVSIQSKVAHARSGFFTDEIQINKHIVQGLIDKVKELQQFKDSIVPYRDPRTCDSELLSGLLDGKIYLNGHGDEIQIFKIKPDEEVMFIDVDKYPFKGFDGKTCGQYTAAGNFNVVEESMFDLVSIKKSK